MASYTTQEEREEGSEKQEVTNHIVLVLEGTNLLDLHEVKWPPLYAYEDRARIDVSGYKRISVLIKPPDDDLDTLGWVAYLNRCYVSTVNAWLKALDAVWKYERVLMVSPIIALLNEHASDKVERILARIAKWPFILGMNNVGSEARLTITNELRTPQTTPDNL